jgi:hypothetical protein
LKIALELLFEQNNERNCRKSIRSTKVGEANVMSYSDIIEARAKRDAKEATAQERKRGAKRKGGQSKQVLAKRTRKSGVEVEKDEIEAMGPEEYCTVLALGTYLGLNCITISWMFAIEVKHQSLTEDRPQWLVADVLSTLGGLDDLIIDHQLLAHVRV